MLEAPLLVSDRTRTNIKLTGNNLLSLPFGKELTESSLLSGDPRVGLSSPSVVSESAYPMGILKDVSPSDIPVRIAASERVIASAIAPGRFAEAAAAYCSAPEIGFSTKKEPLYSVIVPDANRASIPGVGADCGLVDKFSKRLVLCSSDQTHAHYEVGGTSCGKPDCPRHWSTWASRASDRVGCRVWGYKEASKGRHSPRHTVLSVADDDPIIEERCSHTDRANVKFFRKHFTKKVLALGGIGGSIVIHLWRTNDETPNEFEGSKRWDWVREQGAKWKDYTKFSPHAHLIGYGFYSRPSPGDFSYKNFPALPDRDAVESVAYYQISHAPVGVGNSVAYWGCCQPGCLKVVSKGTERVSVFCSVCGAPMIYEDNLDEYSRRRSWAVYQIVDSLRSGTKCVIM